MTIVCNTIAISGTSTNRNYIQGYFKQNDSITILSFNHLGVKNSTVSGGLPGGWKAYTVNGGVDYGNNSGWVFIQDAFINTGAGFLLFFNP
jgi:hypothetical protein